MKFLTKLFSYQTGTIQVKNVIDPIIKFSAWFCTPICLVALFLGWLSNNNIFIVGSFIIIIIIIGFFIYQYSFFAKKDPDRLHSEKYLLELRKLELGKETKKEINIPLSEQILELPISDELVKINESSADEEDKE